MASEKGFDAKTNATCVTSTPGPRAPLSQTLWGIDWRQALPYRKGKLDVVSSQFGAARKFVEEHYRTVFEEQPGPNPFASDASLAKARYYEIAGDFFEVVRDDTTVGLLICTPSDWSSYYIRSAALLPQYQGARIIQSFYTDVLFPSLQKAGVERIELDTSPANLAMMHIATRLKFNQTGTLLSERWGALVHFTKFLSPERENVFLRQFCAGVKYQLRDRLETGGSLERSAS